MPSEASRAIAPVRIVVAEKDRELRRQICEDLAMVPGIDVVGEAVNDMEAVAASARLEPDVLILSLQLPELNGMDVLRVVKWYNPGLRVMALSTDCDEGVVLEALRLGARGFTDIKNRGVLGKAVMAIRREEVWVGRRVLTSLIDELIASVQVRFSGTGLESAMA